MGGKATASACLARSLQLLREAGRLTGGQRAIGEKLKIGENTFRRALAGGNTRLENLEAIASATRFAAWQLLVPTFDPRRPPTLAESAEAGSPSDADLPAAEQIWEKASMEFRREVQEIVELWRDLPGNLQQQFLDDLRLASLPYRRRHKTDQELDHLRRPDVSPSEATPPAPIRRFGKSTS